MEECDEKGIGFACYIDGHLDNIDMLVQARSWQA